MAEDGKRTYSAKQVATRIGTDAKQLRKFLRDPASTYKAVGQGGRYDFPEDHIAEIKLAFDAWNSTKTRRNRTSASPQAKLASASGLIPGQRVASPRPRVDKDNKEGLHHNAMDSDTLQERCAGIGARVKRHGLVAKQGRLIPQYPAKSQLIPSPDEGLTNDAQPQNLDFTQVGNDEDTD